jgi:NAD(P)H-flavin reductase
MLRLVLVWSAVTATADTIALDSNLILDWTVDSITNMTTFNGALSGVESDGAYVSLEFGLDKSLMPIAEMASDRTCVMRWYKKSIGGSPEVVGSLPAGTCTVSGSVLNFWFSLSFSQLQSYDTVDWEYQIGRGLAHHGTGEAGAIKAIFHEHSVTASVSDEDLRGSLMVHIGCMVALYIFIYPFLFFSMFFPTIRPRLRWIHYGIGIVATVLLITGWKILPVDAYQEPHNASRRRHQKFGTIVAWYTIGVTIEGLIINALLKSAWFRSIKAFHAMNGGIIMLAGMFVCWGGWYSWGEYRGALSKTPFVWLVPVYIGLISVFIGAKRLKSVEKRLKSLRECSSSQLQSRLSAGEKLFVLDGYVIDFSRFSHPGGQGVLEARKGEDISQHFRSVGAHSDAALVEAMTLAVAAYKADTPTDGIQLTFLAKEEQTACVISVQSENSTVKRFSFHFPGLNSVGQRLYLHNGLYSRPYTCYKIESPGIGLLSIRIYPHGRVTSMVDALETGANVIAHLGTHVDMLPSTCTTAALVAGGTGITPMLAMIRNKTEQQKLWLFWWVRDRKDLFAVDQLIELRESVVKISIFFSQGDTDGLDLPFEVKHGRVDDAKFDGQLAAVEQVVVCGTTGFSASVDAIAKRSGTNNVLILA